MEKKEGIRTIFREGNISLILNNYEDIFSDFDARQSFSEKAISGDFLRECERASLDKKEGFELVLFVPKNCRNLDDEFKIKKRLQEHFSKHLDEKEKEIKKIKRNGIRWIMGGITVIILRGYSNIVISNEFIHSILSIFEVPGWFLVWEGLGKIFIEAKDIVPDYNFYRKMSRCHIVFRSY